MLQDEYRQRWESDDTRKRTMARPIEIEKVLLVCVSTCSTLLIFDFLVAVDQSLSLLAVLLHE